MKLSNKNWGIFIILSALSIAIWYKLSYSQFSHIDLSISKEQAIKTSESFLRSRNIDPSNHIKAIIFKVDSEADRFLQKTLGARELDFIKDHEYTLFRWIVRFFQENTKEEYIVTISPKTGKIIAYNHLIEDTEKRDIISEKDAIKKAKKFLKTIFGIDFKNYDFYSKNIQRFDNRIDYNFSWAKKGVYIPWTEINDDGGAKLLINTTVSGNEIKSFDKAILDIPEKFQRYIEKQNILGTFLSSFFLLMFLGLLTWSIFIVIKRKEEVVIQRTWKVFLGIGIFIFVLKIFDILNSFQNLLFHYSTSASLSSFIGISLIGILLSCIFISLSIIMPGVAGESLRNEAFPSKKGNSLLHFINSTFLGKSVAKSIVFGYLVFFIALALQSILLAFGQEHLGVWIEKIKLTNLSSAYIPFLGAFIIGCSASIIEETVFRIFAINWAKKYFKNTILAIIFVSLFWGFSHTGYPVYPIWFRGIEVTIIGLFFGFILLKFGIIPLFIAHYLFDVFWGVTPYIFGKSNTYLFYSSIFILVVPLFFALIAYLINRKEVEKNIDLILNTDQKYNIEILKTFIIERKKQNITKDNLKKELLSHDWDKTLVNLALENIYPEDE